MNVTDLKKIMKTKNFSENLENYLLREITENGFDFPAKNNPFTKDKISHTLLLNTIIHCTLLLASLIYVLYDNNKGDNT